MSNSGKYVDGCRHLTLDHTECLASFVPWTCCDVNCIFHTCKHCRVKTSAQHSNKCLAMSVTRVRQQHTSPQTILARDQQNNKTGRSHPLHKLCFGQYPGLISCVGVTERWGCYLMQAADLMHTPHAARVFLTFCFV